MRPEQAADGTRTGIAALVGIAVVAATLVIVAIAWWVIVPAPVATRRPGPSMLTDGVFDLAPQGDAVRATAAARLHGYAWVDRGARVARIPIDVAIDAVVANPDLLERK